MTFTYDYDDLLDEIFDRYAKLQEKSLRFGKEYGKREAYGFIVDYVKTHDVEEPRTLLNRVKERLTEFEAYNKFNPSQMYAGYIEILKDVKKRLTPIVKTFEMKGYKTSVPKLNFKKML